MEGNSSVSGNSAGNGGGGIITFTDTANGYISRIIITDNARISKGENAIISDNHAPSVPNINFTFD